MYVLIQILQSLYVTLSLSFMRREVWLIKNKSNETIYLLFNLKTWIIQLGWRNCQKRQVWLKCPWNKQFIIDKNKTLFDYLTYFFLPYSVSIMILKFWCICFFLSIQKSAHFEPKNCSFYSNLFLKHQSSWKDGPEKKHPDLFHYESHTLAKLLFFEVSHQQKKYCWPFCQNLLILSWFWHC